MAKNKGQSESCELYPIMEDNNPSQLYKDLSTTIKDRSLLNYIYAYYLQSEVGAEMDSLGYTRNKQGQHSAKDVKEFFDVSKLINQSTDSNIINARLALEAVDSDGNFKYYDTSLEILERCKEFNESNKSLVASVIKQGNKFQIIVDKRNSNTQIRIAQVEDQLKNWEIAKQALSFSNINLNELSNDPALSGLVNPIYLNNFLEYLKVLPNNLERVMSKRDIMLLLKLNPDAIGVKRILAKWGNYTNATDKIYEAFQDNDSVTSNELSLILTTLAHCKKLNHINVNAIIRQIEESSEYFRSANLNYSIDNTIKELDVKYGLQKRLIESNKKEIDSLEKAAAAAAISLRRKLYQLESTEGIDDRVKSISENINTIIHGIENNKYYSGCLSFLKRSLDALEDLNEMSNSVITLEVGKDGTVLEVCQKRARLLTEIKDAEELYLDIIKALSNIEKIISEEDIDQEDRDRIKEKANEALNLYENLEEKVKPLRRQCLVDILIEFHGEQLENGEAIVNVVKMAEEDASIFDILQSIGSTNSVIINSLGKIIRDQEDKRNTLFNSIKKRIQDAERRLRKAGFTNSFMYDSTGYIISPYDWTSYKKQKAAFIEECKEKGLRGIELKIAVQDWEEQNTHDVIVDSKSGRAERVPNMMRMSEEEFLNNLHPEQKRYYLTMMQIKGEMGTLVPSYAQKQFLPPQKRRSFLDAIFNSPVHGVKNKLRDIISAFWSRFETLWKESEDSEYYNKNGVIMGEHYGITIGDYDDTPLKQVPIFYVNNISNPNELLRDFSGAILSWANTCISYNSMESIRELVEILGKEIKNIPLVAKDKNNERQAELLERQGVAIFRQLKHFAKQTKTTILIDSFIQDHIYRQKNKDISAKYAPAIRTLLKFVSVTKLSINIEGGIANAVIGQLGTIMEAIGGIGSKHNFFNIKDYITAWGMLVGSNTVKLHTKIIDFFTHNQNSFEVLLSDKFDPAGDKFNKEMHKRFYSNNLQNVLETAGDNVLAVYGLGEYLNYRIVMFAVLNHEKVLLNGKKIPLWQAFEKVKGEDEYSSELKLKEGVTLLDGSEVSEEYINKIKKRIRFANKNIHGAMNEEDKGIIHQFILGKLIMQFKQWMVGFYTKRFARRYWDADLEEWVEGYYNTVFKSLAAIIKLEAGLAIREKGLDDYQKGNLTRFAAEMIILASLTLLKASLDAPEDREGEFWYRRWIYYTRRALADVQMGNPIGLYANLKRMYSNLIPSARTLFDYSYIVVGLGDYGTEIQPPSPDAGEDKYIRNVKEKTIPYYKYIKNWHKIDEDNTIFDDFDVFNRW